jgi:hypothetical protein
VTVNDLLTVAPFGNTLVTVDLSGAQFLRLPGSSSEKRPIAAPRPGPAAAAACCIRARGTFAS